MYECVCVRERECGSECAYERQSDRERKRERERERERKREKERERGVCVRERKREGEREREVERLIDTHTRTIGPYKKISAHATFFFSSIFGIFFPHKKSKKGKKREKSSCSQLAFVNVSVVCRSTCSHYFFINRCKKIEVPEL